MNPSAQSGAPSPEYHPDPDAVASHRAPPGPVGRIGVRAGAGILVLAALAVGGAIANWRPINSGGTEQRERPFVQVGQVGETVSGRLFDATVLDVRGAAKVTSGGATHDTGGVWIVIRLRLTVHTEATSIGYAALRDRRDREYRATTRFDQRLVDSSRQLQPGIPVEGDVAFELPRDAATEVVVQLAKRAVDRRMDDLLEVPLPPVDRATVDKWAAEPTPVVLATPRVVAP